MAASEVDWLQVCRRAAERVRAALRRYPTAAERGVATGRGQGGDTALVIDRAAEDEVLAELEALRLPLTVVSEERGRVELAGGGPLHVVVDPVDGSLNAKRGLPFAALSIAVAEGDSMAAIDFGYVADLDSGREWWARRAAGASVDGGRLPELRPGPLEVIGLETARPGLLAAAAPAIATLRARRVRILGSVALALCLVAGGRIDAMASLRTVRSVDAAAGQLIVREAGGSVTFPEAGDDPPLALEARYRVLAARDLELLERLLDALPG